MPSPFPGMDPYIEDAEIWGDFHSDLAAEIRAELNQQLQPRYIARIIPRVSVESSVDLEIPFRLSCVEVREVNTMQLVTAIEILSPVNKRPGHDAYEGYQRKRRELLRSQAHLLEIDLLRSGTRPPLRQAVPTAPYYVVLSRVNLRPRVDVWPIQLWEPLPRVPIPLLDPDPDAAIDFGAIVAEVYKRGAYAALIDYRKSPPLPAFEQVDQVWIDRQLQTRRKQQNQ